MYIIYFYPVVFHKTGSIEAQVSQSSSRLYAVTQSTHPQKETQIQNSQEVPQNSTLNEVLAIEGIRQNLYMHNLFKTITEIKIISEITTAKYFNTSDRHPPIFGSLGGNLSQHMTPQPAAFTEPMLQDKSPFNLIERVIIDQKISNTSIPHRRTKWRRNSEKGSRISEVSPLRPRSYLKYPSPFPEDNVVQRYSGIVNEATSNNNNNYRNISDHKLHFSVHPITNSENIGSNFQTGEYQIFQSAASQERRGSFGQFPGLLEAPPIQYSSLSGPAFVTEDVDESSLAVEGATAVLTCTIRNLHNYTVCCTMKITVKSAVLLVCRVGQYLNTIVSTV